MPLESGEGRVGIVRGDVEGRGFVGPIRCLRRWRGERGVKKGRRVA